MKLLDGLCEIKPISLHLAEKFRQLNYLILDRHRIFDHAIDPCVNITVLRWLTPNVEFIYSPRELFGIPNCLFMFVPVEASIRKEFGE